MVPARIGYLESIYSYPHWIGGATGKTAIGTVVEPGQLSVPTGAV